jgi:hypothetical protein
MTAVNREEHANRETRTQRRGIVQAAALFFFFFFFFFVDLYCVQSEAINYMNPPIMVYLDLGSVVPYEGMLYARRVTAVWDSVLALRLSGSAWTSTH